MSNANNGFIGRYDAVDFLAKPDDTGRLEQVTLSVYRIPISDLDTLLSLDSEDTPINPEIDKEYFGMREAQTTIRFEPTINGSTVSGELKYRATSPLTTSELDEQNIVTFIWSN